MENSCLKRRKKRKKRREYCVSRRLRIVFFENVFQFNFWKIDKGFWILNVIWIHFFSVNSSKTSWSESNSRELTIDSEGWKDEGFWRQFGRDPREIGGFWRQETGEIWGKRRKSWFFFSFLTRNYWFLENASNSDSFGPYHWTVQSINSPCHNSCHNCCQHLSLEQKVFFVYRRRWGRVWGIQKLKMKKLCQYYYR